MQIFLDRIDYNRDEVTNEFGVVIERYVTSVDIEYILMIDNHVLDGTLSVSPTTYNAFSGDEEIIKYIKNDITKGVMAKSESK